jgi:hypothetical protein
MVEHLMQNVVAYSSQRPGSINSAGPIIGAKNEEILQELRELVIIRPFAQMRLQAIAESRIRKVVIGVL